MKKVIVALAAFVSIVCMTLGLVVIDGPTDEWWGPVAMAVPLVTMAAICFDQRLAIGHYLLVVTASTLGIYWIAMGVSWIASTELEGTQEAVKICRFFGSTEPKALPEWADDYEAVFAPLSVVIIVFGFIWLLPTRRVWDRKND